MPTSLKLFLFGPPRLELDGKPSEARPRKALALLVYLAVTGRPQSREALAALFWPDSPPDAARASLRRTAHRLQQSLGLELLDASPDTVGLIPDLDLWLDSQAFQQEVEACLPATPGGELDGESLNRLDAAVELFADDFLAGFVLPDSPAFDEWQFFLSDGLRRTLVTALDRLDLFYAGRGEYDRSLPYVRRRLALDPLEETTHRRLMQLYSWAEQPAQALRQYEECVRILQEELDVPPDEETTALLEAIRNRRLRPAVPFVTAALPVGGPGPSQVAPIAPSSEQPLPAPAGRSLPNNLPSRQSTFVGRSEEIAMLRRLLEEDPNCRLLTLVGPGGTGKTRLALKVAEDLAADWPERQPFPDGIYYVPLASVSRPLELFHAIGEVVGLQFVPHVPPQQQLFAALRSKQLLLVLDSFEHLLDNAEILSALLAAAPSLKILLTSLEGLDLQEAWFFPVAGLAVPGRVLPAHLKAEEFDSVRFFAECARRARTTFVLADELEPVVRVCRMLEGTPLAIELAAAWLRVLPVAQIAEELERGLDILTARYQNAAPRHRSMRAVLDQSWALLDEREQTALQRLAVFRDGFRLEAADVVAGASLAVLAGLVDRALLRVDHRGRYELHGLLRQFALEKLRVFEDEEVAIRRAHCTFYLEFLRVRGPELIGRRQSQLLAELDEELENLRAAWEWAIEHNLLDAVEQIATSFWRIFWTRGRINEGEQILSDAIFQLRPEPGPDGQAAYARALRRLRTQRAFYHYFLGDYSQARPEFERLAEDGRRTGDEIMEADADATLGVMACWQARFAEAEELLLHSQALYEKYSNLSGMADVAQELARVELLRGRYAEAERYAQESLDLSRRAERPDWIAYALVTLGSSHVFRGHGETAERYYLEGLAMFEQVGHQLGIGLATGGLAWLGWSENRDLAETRRLAERALAICRQIGHRLQISYRLCTLGHLANDAGNYADGWLLAEEGVTLATAVGTPPFMMHNLCIIAEAARGQGRLATARNFLTRALQLGMDQQIWSRLTLVLYEYALLLEAEADAANRPVPKLALELMESVVHHPSTWAVFRRRATKHLARLRHLAVHEGASARPVSELLTALAA